MSGLKLSEEFFQRYVRSGLNDAFPRLPYAAALMGRGSEVLGFDDPMSSDHDWTARLIVLLDAADRDQVEPVRDQLQRVLPGSVEDVPTHLEVTTVAAYLQTELGLDVGRHWDAFDWLSLPEPRLCAITSGAVFHDDVGLRDVRERLAYYPRDVWYYLLAATWWRVHPEMNLVGRAGYAGDDLGSAVMAADMVASLMHLAFLIERTYAPYRKWFGTAFSQLELRQTLAPVLAQALHDTNWPAREKSLNAAYRILGDAFNALQIVEPLSLEPIKLWERPFTVLWADYSSLLTAKIDDPAVRELVHTWPPHRGVDHVRDILWWSDCRPAVRRLVTGP